VSRALVAGAAGGIGRATVRRLRDRGRTVHALDVDAAGLAALPDGVETHAVDATDPDAVAPAVAAAAPDAVVAAVGWYELGAVEDQPADALGRHLETNVVGTHAVVRAALPRLRERGGRVVIVGSVLGRVALPYHAAYAASKHALVGYADALRREVAPRGVDVSVVEPGPVGTGLNRRAAAALDRYAGSAYADAYGALRRRYRGWDDGSGRGNGERAGGSGGDVEGGDGDGNGKRTGGTATDPGAVADAVAAALTADRPRARYPVGRRARCLPRLAAVLPARLFDRIVRSGTTGLLARLIDR